MCQGRPRDLLRVLGTAVALLTLSAQMASSAAENPTAFVKALEKGEVLIEKGKFEKAILELKKAEKLSTEPSVQVLLNLAICFNRIYEFENAEGYARAAVEVAEAAADQAGAYNVLGLSLLAPADAESEVLVEAEAAFRKVLEVTDGQANMARYSLAEVLARLDRKEEAVVLLEEFLRRDPNGPNADRARKLEARLTAIPVIGDVRPPVKRSGPLPDFPPGIEGVVIIKAIIDKNGEVTDIEILKTPHPSLSRAVEKAVKRWKFRPATLNGKSVAVIYNLTVNRR